MENRNRPNSLFKVPKIDSKATNRVRRGFGKNRRNLAYCSANSEILKENEEIKGLRLTLPIKTVSEANSSEPWFRRYGRHKEQQRVVGLALNPLKGYVRLPCRIMLTRFAPDELDTFDNLPMSFKYIVDGICAILTGEMRAGKADSDKRISIACDQVKSKEYGIRIEITF